MHCARIARFLMPLALADRVPQVRQCNVRAKLRDQFLLAVFPCRTRLCPLLEYQVTLRNVRKQ
jgi:hypothetical protein